MSDEFENDNLNLDENESEQDESFEPEQDTPSDEDYSDGSYDDGGDYSDDGYADDGYDDGADDDYSDEGADDSGKGKKKGKKDDAPKVPAKMRREWENEITTNKKVKREEIRRKLKKAMLFMLVFALIVTSIVYVMLLFIQENNVRITASSQNGDNSISLSFDNNYWTPYLNAQGPTQIWDVSYSPIYDREKIDTIDDVYTMLRADNVAIGTNNGENFIRFTFMLRNNGNSDVTIDYKMSLDNDKESGLQNAVRVMWGESYKNPEYTGDDDPNSPTDPTRTKVTVYAARSHNSRLADMGINVMEQDPTKGYLEYVAYPVGSDDPSYDWTTQFYDKLDSEDGMTRDEALRNGFLEPTTEFAGADVVFANTTTLSKGDIMYCYVCIWLEGSDFDCVDSAIGGYVKLGIDFVAY